jgi:hypothetical protein
MKQLSTTRNGRSGVNNDLNWLNLKTELVRLKDLINDEASISDDEQGGPPQPRYQVNGSEVDGRELTESPQDTESRPSFRGPILQKKLQNTARSETTGGEGISDL